MMAKEGLWVCSSRRQRRYRKEERKRDRQKKKEKEKGGWTQIERQRQEREMPLLQPQQINYASKCSVYWNKILCVLWGHENENSMFEHINTTLQQPMFFFSSSFPQDSQSDLVAPCRLLCQPQMVWVPDWQTRNHSEWREREKKKTPSYHKGPFNKPMKKSK